jgi:hypothetical protein
MEQTQNGLREAAVEEEHVSIEGELGVYDPQYSGNGYGELGPQTWDEHHSRHAADTRSDDDGAEDDIEHEEEDYEPPSSNAAWEVGIEHADEHVAAYNQTQPPGGYYTIESFEVTESNREATYWVKVEDGFEEVTRSRVVNIYRGKGLQVTETKTWTPWVRVRMSPIPAYGKNKDGSVNPDKLDSAYKMFCRALQAFKDVQGRTPGSTQEFLDYMSTYPFKVRTMRGEDGSLVALDLLGIKPE